MARPEAKVNWTYMHIREECVNAVLSWSLPAVPGVPGDFDLTTPPLLDDLDIECLPRPARCEETVQQREELLKRYLQKASAVFRRVRSSLALQQPAPKAAAIPPPSTVAAREDEEDT